MRLFLSSQDLGNHGKKAAELAGQNKRVAFLKNAQDFKPPEERNLSTPEKRRMFLEAGFEYFEEIDLRDFFGQPHKLLNKLSNFGSLWSSGGNTLILRRALASSGLDEILKKLLKEDRLLYGGWSAGAMIMTPDLKGPIWSEEDRADIIPAGYDSKVIWDGLNLVPFYIVPHFGSKMHGNSPQELVDYYKSKKLRHYILKDGQVVVIDGDKEELLK
ncbi:MAG TPA: Type 1 glutamine amidotransferase-like domain-containing protein [Candidatus Saccharimonadales bacterium]|nr:Type 1 glutamine amidotransferase-like domain-containing protein [Candidatus Saccharimonadales bacterium]